MKLFKDELNDKLFNNKLSQYIRNILKLFYDNSTEI